MSGFRSQRQAALMDCGPLVEVLQVGIGGGATELPDELTAQQPGRTP